MNRNVLMTTLTVIAVACAAIITAAVVRREFFPSAAASARPERSSEPVYFEGWKEFLPDGRRLGPENAPVTILEFADFECPACQRIERGALGPIRRKYPNDVAVVYRHWPLEYHRFAYPAARASECAGDQGRFAEYHDFLYEKSDSLGLITFHDAAAAVSVPDLALFDRCYAKTDRVPRIDRGAGDAGRAGGTGTPTILINGWRLTSLPDSAALDALIQEQLKRQAGR